MRGDSKKFVEQMLNSAAKQDKPETFTRNDVDINEVEQLTKSIQRRIQRNEKF